MAVLHTDSFLEVLNVSFFFLYKATLSPLSRYIKRKSLELILIELLGINNLRKEILSWSNMLKKGDS